MKLTSASRECRYEYPGNHAQLERNKVETSIRTSSSGHKSTKINLHAACIYRQQIIAMVISVTKETIFMQCNLDLINILRIN